MLYQASTARVAKRKGNSLGLSSAILRNILISVPMLIKVIILPALRYSLGDEIGNL